MKHLSGSNARIGLDAGKRRAIDPVPAPSGMEIRPRRSGTLATVLHLAVDYPNANLRETTHAVRNFVLANAAVEHIVVALTRTADPRRQNLVDGDGAGDPRVVSMRYWGPPKGLLHFLAMSIVALRVRRLIAQRGLSVDLIHAHKLCYEGIAGYLLSRWLAVPLVCSVRGDAERLALRYLPHYQPVFRAIAQRCRRLYYVSAWIRPQIERRLKAPPDRGTLLPNFCPGIGLPTETADADRFVSILHLDVYEKKGLGRLVPAFAKLAARHPGVSLDVIGRGTPESVRRIEQLIDAAGLRGRVRLLGPLPREELMARLPGYGAMCLPSHNETFGMVYVEALLSGVPILYSRGTGIDGFLDGVEGAVGVDPCSTDEIGAALERLRSGHARMRDWLVQNHAAIAARFDAKSYVDRYNSDLGLA